MVIPDGLQNLTCWVFGNSIKATILIVLIFIIQWLAHERLPAKWLHALWFILIVRLLLPAGFESNLSPFNIFERADANHISIRIFTQPVWPGTEAMHPDTAPIPATSRPLILMDLFSAIWILGALAFAIITVARNMKCRKNIRGWLSITDTRFINRFSECRKNMQIRGPVRIAQLNSLQIPMLYGWLHPVILIPSSKISKWTDDQINHILCHELAHLKRHDILFAHVTTVLQIMHWFNPLLWLTFHKMRLDREIACDAIVLNHLGRDQSKSYGSTILLLLENISTQNLNPMTVGIGESKKNLEHRLHSITGFRKQRLIWTIAGLILTLVIGCAALTEAKKKEAKQKYIAEAVGPMTFYADYLKSNNGQSQNIAGRFEISNWKVKSDTSKALNITGKNAYLKQLDTHRWYFEAEKLRIDTFPSKINLLIRERKAYKARTFGPANFHADRTVFRKIGGKPYHDISGEFEISNWKLKLDSTKTLSIKGKNATLLETDDGDWQIMADELNVDTVVTGKSSGKLYQK